MSGKDVKPMLAVDAEDLTLLTYPSLASAKLDGIRALCNFSGPTTRSLKQIPNTYIRNKLAELPVGLDGEIGIVVNGSLDFRKSTSAVMSEDGNPEFKYFVFDYFKSNRPYLDRLKILVGLKLPDWCVVVTQTTVYSADQVQELFKKFLEEGHEGLILRDPEGQYKHGRSTLKQQGMLKCKPWKDVEGVCVGTEEEQQNTNEAETNELGRTKRSSKKEGLVGKGTVGTLLVKCGLWPDEVVEIGTGLTAEDRQRKDFIGKIIKFKHVTVGGYDKPRHPVFLGVRDERDM